jgi:short-subunit dehydrogenase
MDISNKITVITGASEGIGLATARRFAAADAKLVLVARAVDKLTALAKELSVQGHAALALPADMRNRVAVNQMIEQAFRYYGRIDILINNAGQAAAGTVAEVNPDDFRQILELNVMGPLYAMQAVVPKMRQGGGGLIINISSMVTKMRIPALAAYASSKTALNMLSETARIELAPDHIRVITVFPRRTATAFGEHSLGDQRIRERQRSSTSAGDIVDSAQKVADKIFEAAQKEPAEQYMDE